MAFMNDRMIRATGKLTRAVKPAPKLVGVSVCIACCFSGYAESMLLDGETRAVSTLQNDRIKMQGRSALYITGRGSPVQNCRIDLDSEDAWIFMDHMRPSEVAGSILKQIKVNGQAASLGENVRVVQYGEGAVIMPHPDDYKPLELFTGRSFTGVSRKLEQYTKYDMNQLGPLSSTAASFVLKRGYMATLAQNEDGTGYSKCYVAQDFDLQVASLPAELRNNVKFVRIFPWRWTSKKGGANLRNGLNLGWWYNWNLNEDSTLDLEYVAIKQKRWWPGLDQNWQQRRINHLLGYNEPDKSDQANMSVDDAIAGWPELLKTGLRIGSPAVTDGGRDRWLYPFLDKCREMNYRVDYVAVHYYWGRDPGDPQGAASQFHDFLKSVHDRTQLPIWITEWNNGANWTNNGDPSEAQQEKAIAAMIRMLDDTPWVERYAIYNWVEDCRRVQWNDGSLTPAGEIYRDKVSPIAYRQPPPEPGLGPEAVYLFNGDFSDASGNGNNAMACGAPSFEKMGGGMSVGFDGKKDYLKLPRRTGSAYSAVGALSFVGWIRWDGGDKNQRIFDFGNDEGKSIHLTPRSKRGDLELVVQNGDESEHLGGAQLTPGTWTHVAASISAKGSRLFVNGKLVRESPSVAPDSAGFESTQNYIGRGQADAGPLFMGRLFEVRFLDHELSEKEVEGLADRAMLNFDDKQLAFGVTAGMTLSGSLADRATGGVGTLTYAKTAGPDWLTIHPDGKLEGQPTEADAGETRFLVSVQDTAGHLDARYLTVEVRKR